MSTFPPPPSPPPAAHGSPPWLVHARRRIGLGLALPLRRVFGSRVRDQFGILMYHRVAPQGDVPLPPGTVSTARFRDQLRGLLARGFTAWSLRRVLQERAAGHPIPPGTFAVTFDDGYECVYHSALPILKEFDVPATVFLVTSYLDCPDPFPFDVWLMESKGRHPPELGRSVSTAQCREMLASGLIDLGSHTHTHARLAGDPQAFGREVRTSLAAMRERFGLADVTFAYPFGDWSPAMAEEARQAGLLCALTTNPQLIARQDDWFAWSRFEVEPYDTARTLAVKLDGWYDWVRGRWLRWRGSDERGATT